MTDACILPIVAASGVARPYAVVSPIEKPRSDRGLQENATAPASREGTSAPRNERRRSSHSGTEPNAPLWNGPRLQAAFVAQVLGQVLAPQTNDPLLARAAYQGHDVRRLQSRLLDSEA
jgi:hypothetical protein